MLEMDISVDFQKKKNVLALFCKAGPVDAISVLLLE